MGAGVRWGNVKTRAAIVPGAAYYFRAEDANATSWANSGSAGGAATTAGTTSLLTSAVNGYNAVRIGPNTGAQNALSIADVSAVLTTRPITVYVVWRRPSGLSWTSTYPILSVRGFLVRARADKTYEIVQNSSTAVIGSLSWVDDVWNVVGVRFQGTTSALVTPTTVYSASNTDAAFSSTVLRIGQGFTDRPVDFVESSVYIGAHADSLMLENCQALKAKFAL